MSTRGLSSEIRGYIEQLHRAFFEPFTAEDAAEALDLDSHRSVAKVVFKPSCIAGWSTAEYWDLTEQIFCDVLVVTGQRPRDRTPTIGGTTFVLHSFDLSKHCGLVPVWRGSNRIDVTDPSLTVIDLLADPTWGGGIRQVTEMVTEYLEGGYRDDSLLIRYGDLLGIGAVFKRLGFLIEELGIDAPELVERCLERRTLGVNDPDPSIVAVGRTVSRCGVRVKVRVGRAAE